MKGSQTHSTSTPLLSSSGLEYFGFSDFSSCFVDEGISISMRKAFTLRAKTMRTFTHIIICAGLSCTSRIHNCNGRETIFIPRARRHLLMKSSPWAFGTPGLVSNSLSWSLLGSITSGGTGHRYFDKPQEDIHPSSPTDVFHCFLI